MLCSRAAGVGQLPGFAGRDESKVPELRGASSGSAETDVVGLRPARGRQPCFEDHHRLPRRAHLLLLRLPPNARLSPNACLRMGAQRATGKRRHAPVMSPHCKEPGATLHQARRRWGRRRTPATRPASARCSTEGFMAWLKEWLTGSLAGKSSPRSDAGREPPVPASGGPAMHRKRKAKAYRCFTDAAGVTWHVWEVDPREAERRRAMRRVANDARKGGPAARDRRCRESRVATRPGYENGWLAYGSVEGTKRLAPIPPGWTALPDSALDELRRRAVDAERPRPRPGKKRPHASMLPNGHRPVQ